MSAGSIIFDLLMRTGSFETDTARGRKALKDFQRDAEAAGKAVGLAFVGGVAGLAALVTSTINSADHLNDLSKKTGIAVDTLGGIGFAAGQAGGDLESAAAAAGKLNKSLAEAAAGNQEALAPFKALGVEVKDLQGNTKAADVALAELADKFAGYADGPEKSALALKIFGKAGADIIPLLDDGGRALLDNIEYFKRYSGVTVETAEKADQFNDTVGKLKLLSGAFGQQLTAELLPTLQNLADLFLKNKEQGEGFAGTAARIADVVKAVVVGVAFLGTTFAVTGDQIGAAAARIGAFLRGDFAGASAIGADASASLQKARKDFGEFYDAIYAGRKKSEGGADYSNEGRGSKPPARPSAPRLPGAAAGGGTDTAGQELKKRLDGQLRLIQDFERAQADAYSVGNSYLDGVYQDGLISQTDYFDKQRNLRDANLANTLEAIDKEIAAQRDFIASPAAKPTDRVASEEKIKLAVQQRSDAITKASGANILSAQQEQRAAQQLADAYANLRSEVLANSGDEFGAAQLRNAQKVRAARDLITQAGGDPAVADKLAKQLDQQAQANKLEKDYAKLLDDTSRREQEIYLDAQSGGKGELETLAAVRDARQGAIGQLRQQADAAAALASASGNDADIKRAKDLAVAVKKAYSEIDPLAQKFNAGLEDSFSSAFSSFLDGSKSAKAAASDFFSSITKQANDLASKEIAKSIFGGDSGQGGIGGALSKLFGGGSSDTASSGAGAAAGTADAPSSGIGSIFGSLGSAIFGDGSFGDVGKSIGTLFSGTGTKKDGALSSSASSSASALNDLTIAATRAATAIGTGGGSSGGGSLLDLFGSGSGGSGIDAAAKGFSAAKDTGLASGSVDWMDLFSGFFADGGYVPPGQWGVTGERGPEKVFGGRTGITVQPNQGDGAAMRPLTQNVTFVLPGQVTRETQQQLAVTTGRSTKRALARAS